MTLKLVNNSTSGVVISLNKKYLKHKRTLNNWSLNKRKMVEREKNTIKLIKESKMDFYDKTVSLPFQFLY